MAWERVTKKHKSEMRGNKMFIYFDLQLKGMGYCPNQRCKCNCADVLANWPIRFNVKTKYEQDSIVFEWFPQEI